MKIKELSDSQIYALYQNKKLPYFLKGIIDIEFTQRNFSSEYLNTLSQEYKECIAPHQYLSFFQKVLVFLLSPIFIFISAFTQQGLPLVIYLILIYFFVLNGYPTKVKHFWILTALGCFVSFAFILLFSKYYIFKNNFQ